MGIDKQNILIGQIGIPGNFRVTGGDGRAISAWDKVEGADGYVLSYYRAKEPDICIKTRYSQNTGKTILGFVNGEEYLADVCAYMVCDGREIKGPKSEKIKFIPISLKLKAQNLICLNRNESKKIEVEYKNTIPEVSFSSVDEEIAVVDERGMVTAKRKGITEVVATMHNGECAVTKIVCERDLSRETGSDAVVMLMGDLMCAVNHQRIAKNKSFDFTGSFGDIKDIIQKGDLSIGVLETTCSDNSPFECEELRTYSGSPNCNSPSTFVGALKYAGFHALATANNHNCDTGTIGLRKTVSLIQKNGMKNIGTLGDNPVFFNVKGIRIAVIALCMINNGHESEMDLNRDEIGRYSAELFEQYANEARNNHAEFIIAYQHWGKMNSSEVKPIQKKIANDMAELGADLIVASHPHVIQHYDVIFTSDGRQVPCAYSLGNFLTSMSEYVENRHSAIMCCRLHKDSKGEISSSVSFIPTVSVDDELHGVKIHIANGKVKDKIGTILSNKALMGQTYYEPRIMLQGSVVLKKIFSYLPESRVNQDACIISQLSILNGTKQELEEKCSNRVYIDVEKSFEQNLVSSNSDYIVIDFYAAAAISLYKMGNNYYTASETFVNTDFFRSNAKRLKKISPPFDEAFWKSAIKNYAEVLLKHYQKEKIILVCLSFSDTLVIKGEVRNGANRNSLNKRISEMERYFVSIVNPIVIDLAKFYFGNAEEISPSAFEEYFYLDVARKIKDILYNDSHRFYYSECDLEFRMERIIKYYDNLLARGYQNRMFDSEKVADKIMMYSSKQFIQAHCRGIMELMRRNVSDYGEIAFCLEDNEMNRELINAAEAIHLVLQNNLSKSYECYQVLFEWKMRILKNMALQLSNIVGFNICEDECELIFLIKDDKNALVRYKAENPKVTVDIWGSCISREVMNRNKKNIIVNKYIFKQPHLLAFNKPIDCEVPNDNNMFMGNSWRRRTIEEAFKHSGIETLRKSDSEWIVIDFYDLVCNAVMFRGQLWEVDDFVLKTDFYKRVSGECTKNTFFFEKYNMFYAYEQMRKFANFLLERYGENIILIKADLKDTYIDLDYRLKKIKGDSYEFEKKKKAIAQYEKMFENLTGCYVVDISKFFFASDKFPLGGAHIVHYEDEFYGQACAILMSIFEKPKQKHFEEIDEMYLFMRDQKLNRD